MRFLYSIIIMTFLIASLNTVNAQLYEYKDSNGTKRYTDDLGIVPENQRETVIKINSISRTYSSPDSQGIRQETEETGSPSTEYSDKGIEEENNVLMNKQAALKEEYASIQKAIGKVGDPPEDGDPSEAFEQYNREVKELNQRIEAYKKKLANHEKRVQAFNERYGQ